MTNQRVAWLSPTDPPDAFPDIANAMLEPDGLLAAGGDLSSDRLLCAYRKGIFPWFDEGQPILWWSPDPRCVLRPTEIHVSNRLRRSIAASEATLSINQSFPEVVRACAGPRRSEQGTWITPEMISAYETLHAEGWAHSIEVRAGDELVGGLYGLAIGRVFFGESMFSHQANASKLAMLGLCRILAGEQFDFLDCQVESQHLITMGATVIPRREFAARLEKACPTLSRFDGWPDSPISVRDLEA
jgi:leucyl/phenylalanyl-tRNA--protein transferase